jgi:hypothetical protein
MCSDWTRPFPPDKHLHFSPLRRTQNCTDSDGNRYLVFVQNEEFSCALAATAMLIRLLNTSAFTDSSSEEVRLKDISAKFPGSLRDSDKLWSKEPIGKYGSLQFGTMAGNVKSLLDSQKVKITELQVGVFDQKTKKLIAPVILKKGRLSKPGLALWGWYPMGTSGQRTGGHFTTIAGLTKAGRAIILDPWDGSLSEIGLTGRYKSAGCAEVIFYCE